MSGKVPLAIVTDVTPDWGVARAGTGVNAAMITSAGAMRSRARRKGGRGIGFVRYGVFIFLFLIAFFFVR
jgi:hypothetical protein